MHTGDPLLKSVPRMHAPPGSIKAIRLHSILTFDAATRATHQNSDMVSVEKRTELIL